MKSKKSNYGIIRKKKPDTDQIFLLFASSKKRLMKGIKFFLKKKEKKSGNMDVNKIKGQLSIGKNNMEIWKNKTILQVKSD